MDPNRRLDSPAFDHPGTVITASAGDDGYLNWTMAAEAEAAEEAYYSGADYPASSPHVVAVGGTRLSLSATGAWKEETVWNDDPRGGEENYGAGGGGCSTQFSAPEWQREVPDWAKVGCGTGAEAKRAVADISADADPYSGIAVYDSVPDYHEEMVGNKVETINTPLGWWPIGGTSVASPIVASMFALAGGSHGVEYPAQTLYEHLGTGLLHAVTSGGNGECDDLLRLLRWFHESTLLTVRIRLRERGADLQRRTGLQRPRRRRHPRWDRGARAPHRSGTGGDRSKTRRRSHEEKQKRKRRKRPPN